MSYVQTTHGADFFGQDTHSTKAVRDLAACARGCLPYDVREPLARLLEFAGTETEATIPADQAETFADLLRTVASHRFTKAKAAKVARLLGDSAARAAAEGEPWTWTTTATG
ncbi:hypothetical protein OHB41_51820 [Streptomyces sp. NBC_01571]|uniref:DUF7739 domain-containing protein n=1 Tax=Streptomyces sp. NBC_01571 TaxID=2975883 RepID=UPI0022534B68|nr:hypothetical protein [Streptomyces sp. NBC_01571]MCX4581449.1 hypothetical protein [Streptomyces sp. NBC_01571]